MSINYAPCFNRIDIAAIPFDPMYLLQIIYGNVLTSFAFFYFSNIFYNFCYCNISKFFSWIFFSQQFITNGYTT